MAYDQFRGRFRIAGLLWLEVSGTGWKPRQHPAGVNALPRLDQAFCAVLCWLVEDRRITATCRAGNQLFNLPASWLTVEVAGTKYRKIQRSSVLYDKGERAFNKCRG